MVSENKSNKNKGASLEVEVRDIERVLYSGRAKSISSINDKGPFDVLPLHASFISLINSFVKIYENSGQVRQFSIERGVMRVLENKVAVFLGF